MTMFETNNTLVS